MAFGARLNMGFKSVRTVELKHELKPGPFVGGLCSPTDPTTAPFSTGQTLMP